MSEITYHEIADDGRVVFYDENDRSVKSGEELDDYIKFFKKDIIEELKEFVESENEYFNDFKVHLETPLPSKPFVYKYQKFGGSPPRKPTLISNGIFGSIIPSIKRKIKEQNQILLSEYEKKLKSFEKRKKRHEDQEKEWKDVIEKGRFESNEIAEEFLESEIETGDFLGEDINIQVSSDVKLVKISIPSIHCQEFPEKNLNLILII